MNEYARYARDLVRTAAGLDAESNAAVERVGRGALASAQRNAPVQRGDLRRSLRLRRRASVAIVESSLYYAAFQEYGTSRMAPNPFVGPAANEWAPRLLREVEKIRDDVVRDLT